MVGPAAAIVVSTGVTGLLGILFWVVAARRYPPEVVGTASAVVSLLFGVSGLAQLELYGILTKFLPTAGERARTLVLRCYAAAAGIGGLLAVVAVVVAPVLSDELALLRTPLFGSVFVVGVALWGVFVLQDGVLVGVRKAHVTVPENVAFSIAKLVLLVLALNGSAMYVLISYVLPVAFLLVPVNLLVFRRYLPALPQGGELLTVRQVLGFARWDVVASWLGTATLAGVPLVVIAVKGAADAGLFYAAWSMVIVLDLLAVAVGTSLVVRSGYEPGRLQRDVSTALWTALAVTAPLVLGVLVAAPLVLALFGSDYSAAGQGLLRALALAALPRAVVLLASAADRAAGRPAWGTFNTAVAAVCSLAGVLVGAQSDGLVGVGLGWLAGNTVAALVVGPLWWRRRARAPQLLSDDLPATAASSALT